MADYDRHVPAVGRAIDVVEALAAAPDGLSARELDARLGGSRSGLYALLNTLRGQDWVVRDDAGVHHLGPALRRLVPAQDDPGLRRALAEALLVTHPGEAVALVRARGGDRVVVATDDGDHLVRVAHRVGQVRTGPGADRVALDQTLVDQALVDTDVVTEAAGVIRTVHADRVELAAAVTRDGQRPVAAVLVGIPHQRADATHVRRVAEVVRDVAANASQRLGAPEWQPRAEPDLGSGLDEAIGPRRVLDDDEVTQVLTGAHRAQLACLRDDGSPHVVPLWFDWDGTAVWLTASPGAAWADYVGEGARVSLTVEEPRPDLRRVFLSGWAAPVPSDRLAEQVPGGLTALRRRLVARYVGASAADDITDDPGEAGWSAVRVEPDRVHGRAGLGRSAA